MLTAQLPILAPPTRASSTGARAAPDAAGPRAGAGGHVCDVGALLMRVADGDVRAFDDLYERTAHRVYGLVRKVLVDVELSAETTQDVFLALWVGDAARFDPVQGSGMSWMMTLAHRRAVDRVRAEQAHRARDLRWGIKNRDVDYDQVADTVLQRAESDSVRSCLKALTPVQREAIELAYYAGMTYVQVADHLGVPVPTAKTRIRDGIRRLSSCLQDSV
ncbi:sigma-70 family RNA polymerase sigma factor [Arthrobacter cheniae]|uniref:Sigma-70 family RNA polymerase sigma factor n=1 Tax=Arthrobacter cheniae TaxID=1258888 RepID=A0A3A5M9N5_9MICC|nr:ECF RNA polymerase sigma factor SigK [Arthrobacter cheniae]RJT78082.1 sigma-70 family RNA polymerase sigma factor [Arthrobacter cheniae]